MTARCATCPTFLAAGAALSVLAGATAAVAGFGIGSLLTLLFALELGGVVAVAAVAIPHAATTALRAWRLRAAIDWTVLRRFGLVSAAGGLAGALLFARLGGATLVRLLGRLARDHRDLDTATSTATGLLVDAARLPLYVARAGATLSDIWPPILVGTLGLTAGTLLGERVLFGMSAERFRQVIGALVGLLGVWLLFGRPDS